MGKKRKRAIPMFRIPPVDLTRPRVDFLSQFFNPPSTGYGTPVTSFLPPMPIPMNSQPQMFPPPNIRHFNTPSNLPPRKTINDITNRNEMIKLFITGGYSSIPVDDPPLLFNEILASTVGLIGSNQIGHVICRGQPDYETFFCFMCEFWGTPSEMLTHLEDSEHQMKYMQKFFKEKHRKIIVARSRERATIQKNLIMEISKAESDKKVVRRLNTFLNVNILFKCWPNFLSHFNNSWKIKDDDVQEVKTIISLDSGPLSRKTSMLELQCTSSVAEDSEDEEKVKPNIKEMNLCAYALIFIRAQAITKKGITVEEIQKICKVFNVTPEFVFSDLVLEYAGRKIGSVEILVAIAKYYTNPLYPLSELLRKFKKTSPSLEPPKLLLEMGLDKEKAAKMVRDVAMLNFSPTLDTSFNGPRRKIFPKYVQDVVIDDMGRHQIVYNGEYIEEESVANNFQPKKMKQ
uniref:HTH cro/C1-type domain-containing protein n=1 Tax=Panagrolaimus sp. PS1159 TaxID=55785 RepID=A0AC35FKK2_9BILA